MRTMTWEEIDKDWSDVQQRTKEFERAEESDAMYRYCTGHHAEEVAKRIGRTLDWVTLRLDYYAARVATEGRGSPTLGIVGKHRGALEDVSRVVRTHAPKVVVPLKGQGGNQKIDFEHITGEDAEAFIPYLEHYHEQGQKPAAAIRLAKAEWATEAAVDAGVIKESTNKRNEKVNQILFPEDKKETFELDLKMHMSRVKAAAAFLDTANVRYLRRKSTCERVAEANAAWKVQAELVLQHYEPSIKD